LEEKQLYEKTSKCFFGVQEVEYLGHILSHEGVKVDPQQQQVLQLLKDNFTLAQNRMKQQAYQHCSEKSFDIGDWVFLQIQP